MRSDAMQAARGALALVRSEAAELDVWSSELDAETLPSTGARRRATRRGEPDPVRRAALVLNPEGILEWSFEPMGAVATSGRRRAAAAPEAAVEGELVEMFELQALEASSVTAFLTKADLRFNPRLGSHAGLYRLRAPVSDTALPVAEPVTSRLTGDKRRLLIVHGTFSKCEALLEGMLKAKNGAKYFAHMFDRYDEVLVFEHPTLAVSPVLNALDLHRALAGISGTLDIVAHSRGGLVTRWALEAFGVPASRVRAVLVGSPLGGTSLASPPRLKATLGLLTNVGTALRAAGELASAYVPFLLAPMALLRVATSVVSVAAKTPVIDGAIAMVPGLCAQSRVRDNPELLRLRGLGADARIRYYAVTSNFEPEDPGWKLWQWFRGRRLANAVSDKIFPGDNDLVVDTESMTEIPKGLAGQKTFSAKSGVHHTNYFEHEATLDYLMDVLR